MFKIIIVAAFVFYAGYLFIMQSFSMSRNEAQLEKINEEIQAAEVKHEELVSQQTMLNSPEYKEEVARKRDGLVMPDEIIFVDVLNN
ncbi:MAG: septum formation initiator family protein [Clostridiales bacterium]|nr:septum formation initiator family protein [Clostridiales bacterium]